ncbi:formate dehydrogenase accessory sulfurtransferase FdhD [Vibrio rumoiensis]|uniref:Sulfur carrier protein FdhD n=1 Tax=Vibrio rumoiensis 1S-45 TaxID=1188252 RepID=A0A1E5E6G6_9VIBR|nr:formate dehydrogenase accessory sulfurtransferase FdhD [Vibrio rumoiensis]OEF30081.1 formate dehydrogenase family accessory protein FdhD [Vibrio rumoiensis 1S-45]
MSCIAKLDDRMSEPSNNAIFPSSLHDVIVTSPVMRFRHNDELPESADPQQENFATETAVALMYNGISHTVLMCTAKHLEDLAIGFSLSEGIIDHARDIHDITLVNSAKGMELHITLSNRCIERLKQVRRSMAGRTGCGICGSESLDHVVRTLPSLAHTTILPWQKIDGILQQLNQRQLLNQITGATHAAAYVSSHGEVLAVREDIGRHIALDKLVGHIVRNKLSGGAILVTSRASFEMVQKTVSAGIEVLLAISAATSMAVELAQQSNLTLVGFCRPGRADAYTYPERLIVKPESSVI